MVKDAKCAVGMPNHYHFPYSQIKPKNIQNKSSLDYSGVKCNQPYWQVVSQDEVCGIVIPPSGLLPYFTMWHYEIYLPLVMVN